MVSRREFLKLSGATVAGLALTSQGFFRVFAETARKGLSDPALQPKFVNLVPDALMPGYIYNTDKKGRYKIKIGTAVHDTGLMDGGVSVSTPIWGYGAQYDNWFTWPGRTFQVSSGATKTEVIWENALGGVTQHLLPVDTNLHWCYSLPGYTKNSIAKNGVPIITHLHGGHTDFQFDGNPEFFYGPMIKNKQVVGPQWANVPGGFTKNFFYDNDVPAGNL
ncbi:MAG: twin-arginine translocation signal domain-containing protein, partial [Anaerolineales bacterium]